MRRSLAVPTQTEDAAWGGGNRGGKGEENGEKGEGGENIDYLESGLSIKVEVSDVWWTSSSSLEIL